MLLAMRTSLAGPVVAALVTSLTLASCSSDKESAEDVADRLASELETGTLPPELFLGGGSAQEAFDDIVEGLGPDAAAAVEVGEVTEDDGTAEAELSWTWALGDHTWEYRSTATLVEGEDSWQVEWEPALVEPSLTDGATLAARSLAPTRGDILGAGGEPIVIDKSQVPLRTAVASARAVARTLDVDVRPYVASVRGAGERAFVEALVLREADARDVDPAYADIPGAVALPGELPLAPTREFAAPILGRVGPVTAELVEQSEGRLRAGDVAGLSGLQARYDEQLTGTAGLEVREVAEDGTPTTLHTVDPEDGEPLRTTLDIALQEKAERILAGADPDVPAAIVAVRPSDGALLAAANGPGTGGQNIATFGQYAPGSTFKVVSSLALLRSGLDPGSTVRCSPDVVVDGKRFTNYDDYPPGGIGEITLRAALANSCNTAFINTRQRIRGATLQEAAGALGLGTDFDLGFPAYFGQVPDPETETEAAADLIGQGRVLASPLTMAAVAASVRAGRTVVPHLLEDTAPAADPAVPLTRGEATALRQMMRAVVEEGSGRFLSGLPGDVGAKTGTAEYGEPGGDGSLPTHAWMVATQGDLAVAVFVETGESGSRTAGPLLAQFLS
jgi:hypothetical protein